MLEEYVWEYIRIHDTPFDMNSVLTSLLIGPLLTKTDLNENYGLTLLKFIISEDFDSIPDVGFGWIDVRDVCKIIHSIFSNPTSWGRFVCCNQSLTLPELSLAIDQEVYEKSVKRFSIVIYFIHSFISSTSINQ
jgi:hypothetical protein